MTGKPSASLLVSLLCVACLLIGGGVGYYLTVWKPEGHASVPMAATTPAPPVEFGGAAALLQRADEKAAPDASADEMAVAPAAHPAPVPSVAAEAPLAALSGTQPAPRAAAAEPTGLHKLAEFPTSEKPDQLLARRAERRFAKLRAWSAKLNEKRATLKSELQIGAFNEEAKKYHAELNEARLEAAEAQMATAPKVLFAN